MTANEYGPFAPAVGYGGALMATAAAMFFMWGGKMQKWRPPDEDLPGAAQTLVLLLCGVGIIVQWYLAVPETIKWFLVSVFALAVACLSCFLRYSGLLGKHIYIKKIAAGRKATRDMRILGGNILLQEAEARRKELGIDTQSLFEGAAYNADLLWSRDARHWVKQRVLLFFILTLVLGTSALTGASFAIQVLVSNRAAASIVHADGVAKESTLVPKTVVQKIRHKSTQGNTHAQPTEAREPSRFPMSVTVPDSFTVNSKDKKSVRRFNFSGMQPGQPIIITASGYVSPEIFNPDHTIWADFELNSTTTLCSPGTDGCWASTHDQSVPFPRKVEFRLETKADANGKIEAWIHATRCTAKGETTCIFSPGFVVSVDAN